MFAKPTVFVIGAGASAEFGMPVGATLLSEVANDLRKIENSDGPRSQELLRIFINASNNDNARLNGLLDAARQLARAMEIHPSIDEALHYFAGNADAIRAGKLAVALRIMSSEAKGKLPASGNPDALAKFRPQANTWLYYFLSMLVAGTELREDAPIFRNITIVNFNYDRTVEHFLYHSLHNAAARSRETAADSILRLEMLRPYGRIGPLPWEKAKSRTVDFGETAAREAAVVEAANSIRTFTEQFSDDQLSTRLRAALYEAKLVIFLGFGFHPQNMQLLQLPNRREGGDPLILATKWAIDEENDELIRRAIARALRTDSSSARLVNKRSVELLRDLFPMIALRVGR